MKVLLVLVSNLTGRHADYSPDNIKMILADVCAVMFFLFCILTAQIWVKIVCYILAALGFVYLYYLAYKVGGDAGPACFSYCKFHLLWEWLKCTQVYSRGRPSKIQDKGRGGVGIVPVEFGTRRSAMWRIGAQVHCNVGALSIRSGVY